jgi:hypothetical protein
LAIITTTTKLKVLSVLVIVIIQINKRNILTVRLETPSFVIKISQCRTPFLLDTLL